MALLYSLHNLTRRFGERQVLDIERLDIEAGEIYSLLGANGAGKSTLMRILAFLDAPSGGELFFRGQKVIASQLSRFRPGVVWVGQSPVMFRGSLLYNVEYPMALKREPPARRRKRARELLELVKLDHLAQAPAPRLSGGEMQRASIARALAAGARVILFDEPTANVDERASFDFVDLARQLWREQGLSLFITTHNAALAASLCRRHIFLNEGRLARRHLLPGGIVAWPGRLSAEGDLLRALLNADADLPEAPAGWPAAVVQGLFALAAGVVLRLELAPGQIIELLLEDADSLRLAAQLRLGDHLALCKMAS